MIWKKRHSNLIVVAVLSIAYTIVGLLVTIGPLHMNNTGEINQLGFNFVYIVAYWLLALAVSWGLYFVLRNKPEICFFTLIVAGIAIIITEVFLWG